MIQDADYVTNSAYPHQPEVGLGYDMVNMTINPSANPAHAEPPSGPGGCLGLDVGQFALMG